MDKKIFMMGVATLGLGITIAYFMEHHQASAQIGPAMPLSVSSTSLGATGSHMWVVDPRTSLVIHCVAQNQSLAFTCQSAALPGTTMPN